MSDTLNRYSNETVVEHIAARYALGLLTPSVRNRTEQLINSTEYPALQDAVKHHQALLGQLDSAVPVREPDPEVWKRIHTSINQAASEPEQPDTGTKVAELKPLPQPSLMYKWLPLAASFVLFAMLLVFMTPFQSQDAKLSYIAVMTDADDQAALVAATYGESRELMLDLVNLPQINASSSYELWVTSKTDRQARSLGLIDPQHAAISRTLTEAEWRLIKDSATLLVTVEEYGGSSIGEPMGEVVAEGLCVRLSAWEA